MIELSNDFLSKISECCFCNAKKDIAKMLCERFSYIFLDLKDAELFVDESYNEMKKYDIENCELPYWCLLTIFFEDYEFHKNENIKKYIHISASGKIKTMYKMIADSLENQAHFMH